MKMRNWIATEDFSEEAADVSLLEVPAESLESDLVEVTGLDKDIETLVDDGDTLEHDQAQVEALSQNAEASLEEDGMDETAARATEIAAESFCGKWGIQRKKVGLESFGTSDGRRQATQIAVESLKDAVIGLWETFVKWLKELVAKAKEQLQKLTNAGKSLKKRADKLEARLDKGLGVLDKKDVEGPFITQLSIDGTPNFEACVEFANKTDTTVAALGSAVASMVDVNNKILRDPIKPGQAALPAPGADSSKKVVGVEFGKKTQKKMQAPQGAEGVTVTALPAESYYLTYTKGGVSEAQFITSGDKPKLKKLPTLDAAKCSEGVKALYKIGDVLETKLKDFRTANDNMDKLADAAKDAQKELKDATAETRDASKVKMQQAQAAVRTAKAAERAATTSLKNAAAGIAGYVAASIGAYKKA